VRREESGSPHYPLRLPLSSTGASPVAQDGFSPLRPSPSISLPVLPLPKVSGEIGSPLFPLRGRRLSSLSAAVVVAEVAGGSSSLSRVTPQPHRLGSSRSVSLVVFNFSPFFPWFFVMDDIYIYIYIYIYTHTHTCSILCNTLKAAKI
jgi:hypothetical protein